MRFRAILLGRCFGLVKTIMLCYRTRHATEVQQKQARPKWPDQEDLVLYVQSLEMSKSLLLTPAFVEFVEAIILDDQAKEHILPLLVVKPTHFKLSTFSRSEDLVILYKASRVRK